MAENTHPSNRTFSKEELRQIFAALFSETSSHLGYCMLQLSRTLFELSSPQNGVQKDTFSIYNESLLNKDYSSLLPDNAPILNFYEFIEAHNLPPPPMERYNVWGSEAWKQFASTSVATFLSHHFRDDIRKDSNDFWGALFKCGLLNLKSTSNQNPTISNLLKDDKYVASILSAISQHIKTTDLKKHNSPINFFQLLSNQHTRLKTKGKNDLQKETSPAFLEDYVDYLIKDSSPNKASALFIAAPQGKLIKRTVSVLCAYNHEWASEQIHKILDYLNRESWRYKDDAKAEKSACLIGLSKLKQDDQPNTIEAPKPKLVNSTVHYSQITYSDTDTADFFNMLNQLGLRVTTSALMSAIDVVSVLIGKTLGNDAQYLSDIYLENDKQAWTNDEVQTISFSRLSPTSYRPLVGSNGNAAISIAIKGENKALVDACSNAVCQYIQDLPSILEKINKDTFLAMVRSDFNNPEITEDGICATIRAHLSQKKMVNNLISANPDSTSMNKPHKVKI